MKTAKYIFFCAPLGACALSFGQVKEYFKNGSYDEHTAMPPSLTCEYYARAQPDEMISLEHWYEGPHATADWCGFRTMLEDIGIVPDLSYLGNFAANPSGGRNRGATITSSVNLGYSIDLEKLTGNENLKGWSFVNIWVWRFGNSLSRNYIDNQFNVQQNYGSQTIMLESLYLSYSAPFGEGGNNNFMVKFGRMAAGDNFICKPIYWLYMNNAMDGNPVGVFNQLRFSAYPTGTWGVMTQVDLDGGYYGKAGVYQINSKKQDSPSSNGLNWSFATADGVNLNFEFGLNMNHDDSGLSPGNISAGVVNDWYSAEHLADPSEKSHFNMSVYFQADYMVWNMGFPNRDIPTAIRRDSNADVYRDLRGIILWGVVQFSPYDEISIMPFFANGGVLFNAPFESRPDDVLVFGAAYGKYSGQLTTPQKNSYEVALELNYKAQVNRFFFLQPNIQYIINTNGGQHPNALVLGCQFGMNF